MIEQLTEPVTGQSILHAGPRLTVASEPVEAQRNDWVGEDVERREEKEEESLAIFQFSTYPSSLID